MSPAQPHRPEVLQGGPVYLDYNATTPVDPRVVDAMSSVLATGFGNPSSDHAYGEGPRAALAQARARVAALIAADPGEIVFTGSGSEADATAVRGVVAAARRAGAERPHVITQATEHPAVLAACAYAERHHQAEITVLPVDGVGLVSPSDLAAALRPTTMLVSIMHANNETGTIQPIGELAGLAHKVGALFHTDAAQSVGKVPVSVRDLDVDLLTLVGHKMYAPKGIGALYVRSGIPLEALIGGGGQEGGRRAGTENVPYAVALGAAAELAAADLASGSVGRLTKLRDRLNAELEAYLPRRLTLNGHPERRLPQTLNVSIDGVVGHDILQRCADVAASTGSACHSGDRTPSPVLTAMGVPAERGLAALRLSLGRWTTEGEVIAAAEAIANAVGRSSNVT